MLPYYWLLGCSLTLTLTLTAGLTAAENKASPSPGAATVEATAPTDDIGATLVEFETSDRASIVADLYGTSEAAVVLAHGARFNKESWGRQAQAIAVAGYQVMAINFRGYGQSRAPDGVAANDLHLDLLAAANYLRKHGAKSVAVIGGSMGGLAAAKAVAVNPQAFDRLVLLGATPDGPPRDLVCPKLYIMTCDDGIGSAPRLPGLLKHFEQAPSPKELLILNGSAHAQFIFETPDAQRVLNEIVWFLAAPVDKNSRPATK